MFWLTIGVIVAALLLVAWRIDPHHRYRGISRRRPEPEQARAEGVAQWDRNDSMRGGDGLLG